MTREEVITETKWRIQYSEANGDTYLVEYYKYILKALSEPTTITENMTNGDVIKAMFPDIDISITGEGDVVDVYELGIYCQTFDTDWFNALYKGNFTMPTSVKSGYEDERKRGRQCR